MSIKRILLFLLVVAVLGFGVTWRADAATPGDPWFGLDLSLEAARLRLARNAWEAVNLQRAIVKERQAELDLLSAQGAAARIQQARQAYEQALDQLAFLEARAGLPAHPLALAASASPNLQQEIDRAAALAGPDPRCAALFLASEPAQALLTVYGPEFATAAHWFCLGYSLEEIERVYEIAQDMALPAEVVFAQYSSRTASGFAWDSGTINAGVSASRQPGAGAPEEDARQTPAPGKPAPIFIPTPEEEAGGNPATPVNPQPPQGNKPPADQQNPPPAAPEETGREDNAGNNRNSPGNGNQGNGGHNNGGGNGHGGGQGNGGGHGNGGGNGNGGGHGNGGGRKKP